MKKGLVLIATILAGQVTLYGQSSAGSCACPAPYSNHNANKPDRIFHFSNGKAIGLCGYYEVLGTDTSYSEFVIFDCDQSKSIDEWGAVETCSVAQNKDTLVVKKLYMLALGLQSEIFRTPFYITKYYFEESELIHDSHFRNDLPLYTRSQIETVLMQYCQIKKKENSEAILLIAHRLFWAYVSGSRDAEKYLKEFEKKAGPFDGAVAEEFHELWDMYQLYKINTKRVRD